MELMKEFRFEASHILPKHPGKCSRLHGHSWVLRVYVKGEVNPETGFVMDYGDIKKVVQPIVDLMDHHHLGTWHSILLPFNSAWGLEAQIYPSSENLLMWIAEVLTGPKSTASSEVNVLMLLPWSRLELNETCTSAAILTREEYDALQR